MGLQCKGVTALSSPKIFVILGFIGVLGAIIWYTQSPSGNGEESDESSSSSSSTKNKKCKEDEMEGNEAKKITNASNVSIATTTTQKITTATTSINDTSNNLKKRSIVESNRQIDTIYESQLENSPSVEEKFNLLKQHTEPAQDEEYIKENVKSVQSNNIEKLASLNESLISPRVESIQNLISTENKESMDDTKSYLTCFETKTTTVITQIELQNTEDVDNKNSLLGLFNVKHINAIEDHFKNLNEIATAIKNAGLEKSQLIFGIDFTISNLENGTKTFNGRSLHYCDDIIKNPYQKVIEIMGKSLECFDEDGQIPAYGFGDDRTKDRRVFPFSETGYCNGFKDVLKKYNRILREVKLSGPTNFAPLIKEAIRIVKQTKQYHILVIVADGQVTNERQTRDAIVEASKYPISIIMVGVGDGPWDTMNEFDDSLPKRQFDNFQFVNYHEIINGYQNPDEIFALHALMEIPDQYKAIKELGLLNN